MKREHLGNFGRKGWELTIYCLLVYFFAIGGIMTMNVLAMELNAEKGWSMTALYAYETIGMILCVITYFFLGVANNKGKLNLRVGLLISGIGAAVLIALWGIAGSMPLVLFVVVASLTYVFAETWGRTFNDNIVANWFPTKKGEVMGWTTIGFPVGSAFGVLLYLAIVKITGSSAHAYIVFAAVFVILAIWGFVSFRAYPEMLGYYPDNDHTMTREKAQELLNEGLENSKHSPWTTKRILGTWQVWAIAIGLSFMEFFAGATIVQMIPNLAELGYNSDTASFMMTVACLVAGVASVIWGIVDRKIGPRKAVIVVLSTAILAAVCRLIALPITIWISLVCVGAVLGGGPNFTVSLVSSIWGRYDFKKVFGTVLALSTLFASAGSVVLSAVAERSNYGVGYMVLAAFCAVGIVIMVIVKESFVKKIEEQYAETGQ